MTARRRRPAHTGVHPYGANLYLVTTDRQFDELQTKLLDGTGLVGTPWESVGTTRTIWPGDDSSGQVPEFHIIIGVDGKVLDHPDTPPGYAAGVVAHEAFHAACQLLDHVGEEYDGQSEAAAYLVGWITAWVTANL